MWAAANSRRHTALAREKNKIAIMISIRKRLVFEWDEFIGQLSLLLAVD